MSVSSGDIMDNGGNDIGTNGSSGGESGRDPVKRGFIPVWVVLIILGIAVEFAGRFFGYESNPLQSYHSWAALLTATLAGVVAVVGYFVFVGAKQKGSTLRRRNGVLLIVLGGLMVATSFIFKMLMPVIFG